ncbi:DNA (cytosine-5)-methyltransferase 1A [Oryza brachyantha]|uniref:DNA (cytosine-5)-methyltransferase 1A n=1 Tax=Oryza brachyantha TaxID=4533 RepID=UPI0003EAC59C|nr:DNA (cytosine-5)-methyltransferase 1A [Oryza brachyantha]
MAKSPRSVVTTGTKRPREKARKKKNESTDNEILESEFDVAKKESNGATELANEPIASKRPKRAAACSNFKEKALGLSEKDSIITIKESRVEEEEIDAVNLTRTGPEDGRPCRKIVDFILHDGDGNPQPFEMSEVDDIFISALVMPLDDDLEKDKGRGIRCAGFGRIENWAISGYDEGAAVIWVSTETADYRCVKPASSYKSCFEHFSEKARVCVEVYKKLARSVGGNPQVDLEELIAGVVRSINSNRSFAGTVTKDFVISSGQFIYKQLIGLDHTADNDDEMLSTLPVLVALKDECKSRAGFMHLPAMPSNGTLRINDGQGKGLTEEEDAKLARLLQEEEEWKMMRQRGKRGTSQKNIYIKISETEIANDYPLPAYYKPYNQEMDEYIFDSDIGKFSDDVPVRILDNWALYNSDSRLISLELIPMKAGAENDTVIFGSGFMREDDGSCCSTAERAQLSSSSSKSNQEDPGVPIYLSPIKEWIVEFGGSMICIAIRTDVAWYKLRQPTKQYAPWCEPVLKTAKLAVSIITLLKEQSRASKLSFAEVIKKVAEFDSGHPAFVSSKAPTVERYIVVHGQIILQQFADFPDESVRRCAFATGLLAKMEESRHTKLAIKKKSQQMRGENLNPSAKMGPILRRKLMRATTTTLISKIWGDYYATYFPGDTKDQNEQKEIEDDQEENEDNDAEDEVNVENDKTMRIPPSTWSRKLSSDTCKEIEWEGQTAGKTASGEVLYKCVRVQDLSISVGAAVILEDDSGESIMCFVEYMYEKHDGKNMVHGILLQEGSRTILGNAANEREVFLTNDCLEFEVSDIKGLVTVNIQSLHWGHKYRKENSEANRIEKANAEERKRKGLPVEYFCKSLYWPEKGGFFSLRYDEIGNGTGICSSCERKPVGDEFKILSETSFVFENITYNTHDFLYIRPEFFSQGEGHETYKAGRNVGLKPYAVCHLLSVHGPAGSRKANPESTKVTVRRFYRPDDISSTKAYSSHITEVYYSEEIVSVPVVMIEGKCEVRLKDDLPNSDLPVVVEHVFYCEYLYDPANGALKQLPPNIKLVSLIRKVPASKKNKGKQICDIELGDSDKPKDRQSDNCLATLDIFAGCGGLSEGLQRSEVSLTKWAIEYEEPAGEAFGENHPEAAVFVENCNVILKAIMDKCGDADDCISTSEAAERAAKLSEDKIKNLPVPGEVEFINGGPPCQGFSGMNRFNQSPWSKVQCEMILAFLSFAEYFRPRFFLLENVRNFVSFNKGQTFRLTLASLLEMGYQVRFGILEAGAYGVAQSRKRAFIWAAAPGEALPEWPEPMHVFASPELKITLPDGKYYAAVKSTAAGAPFRSITVRDTIGDLPAVENGAGKPTIQYGLGPVSWFQKKIRGDMASLNDHISKEMNELNLIRCKHVPKRPGCDWHDLPEEKVKLSTGQMVDLIPWCLPKTAKRHNQWKGLYGRLDWEGNFPTSVTDPQPMGKVGMCFHPEQDRIITVRECARSQGFPDSYRFAGNIQSKHRQIGNAVPPPLAYALGRKLKQAIDAKR